MSYTKRDYKKETKRHRKKVEKYLNKIGKELKHRGRLHDLSKLDPEESDGFIKITPLLKKIKYGSDKYKKNLKLIQPAIEHHYKNNPHHPEYKEDGIYGMSLLDILEMLCDWLASTERQKDGDIFKSIEFNTIRFRITPQLEKILKNTIPYLKYKSKIGEKNGENNE